MTATVLAKRKLDGKEILDTASVESTVHATTGSWSGTSVAADFQRSTTQSNPAAFIQTVIRLDRCFSGCDCSSSRFDFTASVTMGRADLVPAGSSYRVLDARVGIGVGALTVVSDHLDLGARMELALRETDWELGVKPALLGRLRFLSHWYVGVEASLVQRLARLGDDSGQPPLTVGGSVSLGSLFSIF